MSQRANLITTPNVITCIGIISALFMFKTESRTLEFVLLSFVLASDLLDGFLARLLNQKTEIGRGLDAIRDLTFLTWFMLAFVYKGISPNIMIPLYIAQISLIIMHISSENEKPHTIHKGSMAASYISSYLFIVFGLNLKIFTLLIYPAFTGYILTSVSIFTFFNKNKKAVD